MLGDWLQRGVVSAEATESHRIWTVAEAKARLSHILRCAEEDGPQRIGTRRTFVVVPEHVWQERAEPDVHVGRWLVENMPRGYELELPDRRSIRPIPFFDHGADDAGESAGRRGSDIS
ncbi:hypothetical protein [Candidatus Poriferisodalis sp.]|uniref:hypothetical protein n=1 Tax=Candidatus Poriferisodalis sp. TaxID=3101277 RepID=UPI003B01912D